MCKMLCFVSLCSRNIWSANQQQKTVRKRLRAHEFMEWKMAGTEISECGMPNWFWLERENLMMQSSNGGNMWTNVWFGSIQQRASRRWPCSGKWAFILLLFFLFFFFCMFVVWTEKHKLPLRLKGRTRRSDAAMHCDVCMSQSLSHSLSLCSHYIASHRSIDVIPKWNGMEMCTVQTTRMSNALHILGDMYGFGHCGRFHQMLHSISFLFPEILRSCNDDRDVFHLYGLGSLWWYLNDAVRA